MMEHGEAGFFYVLRTRIPLARSLTVPDRETATPRRRARDKAAASGSTHELLSKGLVLCSIHPHSMKYKNSIRVQHSYQASLHV
jgi:hypothetical protein